MSFDHSDLKPRKGPAKILDQLLKLKAAYLAVGKPIPKEIHLTKKQYELLSESFKPKSRKSLETDQFEGVWLRKYTDA